MQNKLLMIALTVSAAAHAVPLFLVTFVDPDMFRVRSSDPSLEIILVNARSDSKPPKPDALAQANLDGGGSHDAGRRTSPLPSSFEVRDGDTLEAARRAVQQLEEEQRNLLTQLTQGDTVAGRPVPQRPDAIGQQQRAVEEARAELKRMQAEIAKQISDYQKRPRKHHFMPSTSAVPYARYAEEWRARVERVGNEHYPPEARGKYYGNLRMTVAIRKDGSLVDAIIEQSSGSPVLDRAAKRIVKLAGPFPPFPPEMARDTDVFEITRTWIFSNNQLATRAGESTAPQDEPAAKQGAAQSGLQESGKANKGSTGSSNPKKANAKS